VRGRANLARCSSRHPDPTSPQRVFPLCSGHHLPHSELPNSIDNDMTTLAFTLSPASTAKIHDALSCLSKFSDQISLEARRNQLCLSALNSTKSAYVAVALAANRFFDEYTYVGEGGEERWTCRLQAKVASLEAFVARALTTRAGAPLCLPPTLRRCQRQIHRHPTLRSSSFVHRFLHPETHSRPSPRPSPL
jgi:hypothetical protein